jgi:Rrf2 family protein
MGSMRVTAKAEYAVRAVMELAGGAGAPVKRDTIVAAQSIPPKFLENILSELRHAGLVESQRGSEGGYWLSVPPEKITVADIMRAVEGPLASVRSSRPETLEYEGLAEPLQYVWVALRTSIRSVLETVTVADLTSGKLPKHVIEMTENPEAWVSQ